MESNAWSLGIDFGTSNTAAAHTSAVKGNVEVMNLSHNRTTMSSAVYLENADTVEVGEVAIDRAVHNPAGFIPSPKRLVPQHTFQVNGVDLPSSKPVAAILSSVLQRAMREHAGIAPQYVILTHPEAWSEEEINVLLDAAKEVGMDASSIKTVSEPKAAAHYYSRAQRLNLGEKIAVFDFGGGTLDVAVLEAQADSSFSVVAARGDQNLGGKTFDALLRRWVDEQLEEIDADLAGYLRSRAPLAERHALEDSIRRAKELLSESSTATIGFSAAGEQHRLQITRDEFEDVIRPHIDRAVELTRRTLAEANVHGPDDIKALYLTGGSSRIPVVQEALKPLGPVATLDDPKTVVAQGALSAVIPVISHITASNTGVMTAPPPQTRRDDTAELPVVEQAPVPRSTGGKKRWLIITAAVVGVVVAGAGAFALTGGKSGSQSVQEVQTSAVESTPTSAPETSADSYSMATEIRDASIAAIPAKVKPWLTSCTAATFNISDQGAECSVDIENPEAATYFDSSETASRSKFSISVSPEAVSSLRAWIRDNNSFVESQFENGQPVAYGIAHNFTNDGSFDVFYADTDHNLAMIFKRVESTDKAKQLLGDLGLI